MAITFNTTYTGSEVEDGTYTLGVFTGSSLAASTTSLTVSGTVTGTGSTVTVTDKTATGTTTGTATYEGYISSGGVIYYVFSSSSTVIGAFAVSSTGSTLSTAILTASVVSSGLPSTTCFLSGTLIATPDGETAIEQLLPGDLVATSSAGAIAFAPVRWIGRGRVQAGPNGHHLDDAPIRIKAGALADALPARDLLVTPEHCLLLDGVLVPARMLVNGGSITSETAHGDFSFFHVELDRHAILIAEGVEAESYLDTGNRANFLNHDVAALRADFALPHGRTWSDHAAAPLAVDRGTVEPIWTRLAERARTLGFVTAGNTAEATQDADPALHIVTEAGQQILPTLTDGQVHAFVVPAGAGALRLRSRSGRPSELVGPFLDDRRQLGVQIGRIGVGNGERRDDVLTHLTAPRLSGWHAPEAENTRRWTDGDAVLPIDAVSDTGNAVFLDIEVVGIGPFRTGAKAA